MISDLLTLIVYLVGMNFLLLAIGFLVEYIFPHFPNFEKKFDQLLRDYDDE